VSSEKRFFRWRLKAREARMLVYLLVALAVAAWKFLPRPWHPTLTMDAPHYTVYSTASQHQTKDTAHALELLYAAYLNRLGSVVGFESIHPKLKIKLFKDRAELRRINPDLGWAEAFYREPFCRAYFSADESNPYHWMLHESVHQLNHEVSHLKLAKWLEEGLAEYFSTSRFTADELSVGRIDLNTYPVWWIDEIATRADLAENLRNGSVIPLRAIITDHGGPSMKQHFNLYYLHWWTLTHFLWESEKYHSRALMLAQQGGGLAAFEEIIGPVDQVQAEWHAYVRQLKTTLAGNERDLLKIRRSPEPENSADKAANKKADAAQQPRAEMVSTNPSAGNP
jgi:hypothetical protein